jgi:hypothetical protein
LFGSQKYFPRNYFSPGLFFLELCPQIIFLLDYFFWNFAHKLFFSWIIFFGTTQNYFFSEKCRKNHVPEFHPEKYFALDKYFCGEEENLSKIFFSCSWMWEKL